MPVSQTIRRLLLLETTRPRRVFWNRASIVTAVILLFVVLFVMPSSSGWRSLGPTPAGQGLATFGLLKPVEVRWVSPAPADFWSSAVTQRTFVLSWPRTLLSILIIACMTTALIAFARWDNRRARLVGRCDECGQDLTGVTSDRCPECGTPIIAAALKA